jgi:Peptidase family S41/Tricorn protease C1 domain
MSIKYRFLSFMLAFTLFTSCEKILVEPTQDNTPTAIFEQTWTAIDQKYAFLTYKNINWDSIGAVYRKQVSNSISDDSLFAVLDKMLYTLKDGHVNLKSPFNRSRNWTWYLDYPQNYDEGLVQRNYLGNWKTTGALSHQRLKNVAYIHYESFSDDISDDQMNYLVDTYKDAKGVIFDIRNNGGGSVSNVFTLLKHFTDKATLVGKIYEKNGAKRTDFTAAHEIWTNPSADAKTFADKKIIILTNRKCYSAASFFPAMAKAFPNVTTMGDWTGGGGGLPTSLELSNGWALRYSSTITTDTKDFNFENGVPPTVKVDMTKADLDKGKDSILERALGEF